MPYMYHESELILFISIDLVDSTLIKEKVDNWERIFDYLYKDFIIAITNSEEFDELNVWKYIGDEIIFTYKIDNFKKVSQVIDRFKSLLDREKDYTESIVYKNKLEFKMTCWLAGFPVINKKTMYDLKDSSGQAFKVIDYIGPSIDIGFRLSKFSTHNKICISVELAYLLSKDSAGLKKLNGVYFLGLKKMKGVIREKDYAIFYLEYKKQSIENKLYKIEQVDRSILRKYCTKFIKDIDNELVICIPYVCKNGKVDWEKMPEKHRAKLYEIASLNFPTTSLDDDESKKKVDGAEREKIEKKIEEIEKKLDKRRS